MHDAAEILKAIAWPVTVLIALWVLRNQTQVFIAKMTEAIGHAAQISIGKKGLEIKLDNKIAAVNSRIAALNASQDQVKEAVYKAARTRRRRPAAAAAAAAAAYPKDL